MFKQSHALLLHRATTANKSLQYGIGYHHIHQDAPFVTLNTSIRSSCNSVSPLVSSLSPSTATTHTKTNQYQHIQLHTLAYKDISSHLQKTYCSFSTQFSTLSMTTKTEKNNMIARSSITTTTQPPSSVSAASTPTATTTSGSSNKTNPSQSSTSSKDATNISNNSISSNPTVTKTTVAKTGRLRELWHKYGVFAIGTYGVIYVTTLGALYAGVSSHMFGAGDATQLLQYLGLDRFLDMTQINGAVGNFTVAWLLAKLTEPIRMAVTVMITPSVARVFRARFPTQSTKDITAIAKISQTDVPSTTTTTTNPNATISTGTSSSSSSFKPKDPFQRQN